MTTAVTDRPAEPERRRARPRAVPARADRLLLPDARLPLRRRRRRPGDARQGVAEDRRLRGPLVGALLALPDRHQRLPRRPARRRPPRHADGPVLAGAVHHRPWSAAARADVAAARSPTPTSPTPPTARCSRTRCASPSSRPCSTCRRDSARRSCCATCSPGPRPTSPSCSRRPSPRSTAPCSGPAPRWPPPTPARPPPRSATTTARCSPATSRPSSPTTWTRCCRCCTPTRASRCRRSRCGCPAGRTCSAGTPASAPRAPARAWCRSGSTGSPGYAQYKPHPDGGFEAWCLQVVEVDDGQVVHVHHFLGPELFLRLGLPVHLEA